MSEFDRLISGGEAALQALVGAGAQEGIALEFKADGPNALSWIKDKRLSDQVKKTLAKAVSAFANSAGGLLILGLDARRNSDGIDEACSCVPFPEARLLNIP